MQGKRPGTLAMIRAPTIWDGFYMIMAVWTAATVGDPSVQGLGFRV